MFGMDVSTEPYEATEKITSLINWKFESVYKYKRYRSKEGSRVVNEGVSLTLTREIFWAI